MLLFENYKFNAMLPDCYLKWTVAYIKTNNTFPHCSPCTRYVYTCVVYLFVYVWFTSSDLALRKGSCIQLHILYYVHVVKLQKLFKTVVHRDYIHSVTPCVYYNYIYISKVFPYGWEHLLHCSGMRKLRFAGTCN
jgi:hypothetical protein